MEENSQNNLPKARHERLIVKELVDETLVYDLVNDKAHCLNQTSALVWKNCDGNRSISQINASLSKELGTPVDEKVVWLALAQLEKFNLLQDAPTMPAVLQGLNRRHLIRTLGVAAVALPVIFTMTAPTAQAQASCLPSGAVPGGCNATTNCCSGVGNCKNPSQCN